MKKTIIAVFFLISFFSCNRKVKKEAITEKHVLEKKDTTAVKSRNLKPDSLLKVKEIKPVLGIDVSHFQGDVDWKKVKQSGVQFCYAKATQGKHYKDPKFSENKTNTLKAGLTHGAYHFYVVGDNPQLQAESFLSCLDKKINKDMLPMLDLEQGGVKGKVDVKQLQKDVLVWLNTVEAKLNVKPIIYTNNPFAKAYLQNSVFSKYKLWLAEYGVKKPRVPSPWKNWTIWQRSEKGFVPGAKGNIDHDILNSKFQLKNLIFNLE